MRAGYETELILDGRFELVGQHPGVSAVSIGEKTKVVLTTVRARNYTLRLKIH